MKPTLTICKASGAAYLKLNKRKVRATHGLVPGKLLYDTDSKGNIIGMKWIQFKKFDASLFSRDVIKNLIVEYK